MLTGEAGRLGRRVRGFIHNRQGEEALLALAPVLSEKTPFRILDRIGLEAGDVGPQRLYEFLAQVADSEAMGGWPLCGSALSVHLDKNMAWALEVCRMLTMRGDVWHAADALAERVPGPALVRDFNAVRELLEGWRSDPNRWVRRAVGVAAHLWAKRSKGDPAKAGRAQELLRFLEPLFEEQEMDAAKGVGWGLKTLGRFYPAQTAAWLGEQIRVRKRRPRAVVLRKAMTFISPLGQEAGGDDAP